MSSFGVKFIAVVSTYLCLVGFAAGDVNEHKKVRVVASIKPLALLAEAVAGDLASVETLLPTSASPHHYALKISDMQRLQKADVLIWGGAALEPYLLKAAASRGTSLAAVEAVTDDHGDPHVWLSTRRALAIAGRFQALLEPHLDTTGRQVVEKNLQALSRELQQLRHTDLDKSETFVAYHDAFSHFVEDFELAPAGALLLTPDQPLSAKKLHEVAGQYRNAGCLLVDIHERKAAERYRRLLNLPVQTVDIMAVNPEITTFVGYLTAIVDSFNQCFNSGKPSSVASVPQ